MTTLTMIHTSFFFLSSLLTLHPSSSQISYRKITSQTCTATKNQFNMYPSMYPYFNGKSICKTAATFFQIPDPKPLQEEWADYPRGCYYYTPKEQMYYNKKGMAVPNNVPCTVTQPCLCIFIPDCTNTNGTTLNVGLCLCGTPSNNNKCSTQTGLHCYKSIQTCRTVPPCMHTNGLLANNVSCQCGTTQCTSVTGLQCDLAANYCQQPAGRLAGTFSIVMTGDKSYSKCDNVPNRRYITDAETCGVAAEILKFATTSNVPASYVQYSGCEPGCYVLPSGHPKAGQLILNLKELSNQQRYKERENCRSKNWYSLCITANACRYQDGVTPNSGVCNCGIGDSNTILCTKTTGFHCAEHVSGYPTCSKSAKTCEHTDGIVANNEPCTCGSTSCDNSTGLFCFNYEYSVHSNQCTHGPYYFYKTASGKCNGNVIRELLWGSGYISSKDLCNEAATTLVPYSFPAGNLTGLEYWSTDSEQGKVTPPGCFFNSQQATPKYFLANDATANGECTAEKTCMCMSAPSCRHKNGKTPNKNTCLCGKTICMPRMIAGVGRDEGKEIGTKNGWYCLSEGSVARERSIFCFVYCCCCCCCCYSGAYFFLLC